MTIISTKKVNPKKIKKEPVRPDGTIRINNSNDPFSKCEKELDEISDNILYVLDAAEELGKRIPFDEDTVIMLNSLEACINKMLTEAGKQTTKLIKKYKVTDEDDKKELRDIVKQLKKRATALYKEWD